ncbi:hypothetical protein NA78x_005591 [Anatilimnocola sp. NA78]|uniref:hypothetical protein n=1 Tax=Anatilimnocola sp. NA78 TaxID=3415683 RepID=UPI003CE4541C
MAKLLGSAAALVLVGSVYLFVMLIDDNKVPAEISAAWEKGESVELLSLEPIEEAAATDAAEEDKTNPIAKPERFHDYVVLGSTKLTKQDRQTLLAALQKSSAENNGTVAGCFLPRHGIRIQAGKQTVELVICFQCMSVQAYIDGKPTSGFPVTNSPLAVFNKVLTAAKVKLPEQAEE